VVNQEYNVDARPMVAQIFASMDESWDGSISLPGNSIPLFGNRLSDVEVIAMVQTILHSNVQNLTELDLSYHTLSDSGAMALSLLFQVRTSTHHPPHPRTIIPYPQFTLCMLVTNARLTPHPILRRTGCRRLQMHSATHQFARQ
jgi:hypothetical protein